MLLFSQKCQTKMRTWIFQVSAIPTHPSTLQMCVCTRDHMRGDSLWITATKQHVGPQAAAQGL